MHHRHVLFFNLGTAGVLSLNGVQVDLNPGEAVMVLPYQFHSFPMVAEERMLWVMISFETSTAELLEVFRNKSFRVSEECFDLLGQVIEDFSQDESDFLNVTHSLKVSLLLHNFREQLAREGESTGSGLNSMQTESAQLVADIEQVLVVGAAHVRVQR